MKKDLQDLRKQAQPVERLKPLITLFLTADQLKDSVIEAAFQEMIARDRHYPPCSSDLRKVVHAARDKMPGLVAKLITLAEKILSVRREVISAKYSYNGMREDLQRLVPPDFLVCTPFEQLQHLPRYLRALLIRAERAENDPKADALKVAELTPYQTLAEKLADERASAVWWMVEELRVSLFAQKLGTAYPISGQRIDKVLKRG
jgi:ATP-dependent helicase HrpA